MALESFSKEKKEAIASDYLNPNVKVNDIYPKYHISPTTLKLILDEYKIPRRQSRVPNEPIQERQTIVCTNCGSGINPIGAKFCCICGKPILTPKRSINKTS